MGFLSPLALAARTYSLFGGALALFLLSGCAVEAVPELLDVREVGPSVLEEGAALEVLGTGLPERQSGTAFLTGSVFTPGRAARPVQVALPAFAESRSRVEVVLDNKPFALLAEGAPHVTFRGKVSLEFAAPREAGPILRGESQDVVLDFFGRGVREAAGDSSNTPGDAPAAFATFLGIGLGDTLEINEVLPDSEGARAGLLVGDQLRSLDGVRLDTLVDFSPAAFAQVSSLEFVRPGHRDAGTALLDRSEYQPLSASSASQALVVVLAGLLALVLAARPPRALIWIFARRAPSSTTARTEKQGQHWGAYQHVCFLVVVMALWLALARPHRPSAWFDLELGCTLGLLALLLSAFMAGGRRAARRATFSAGGALLGACSALVTLLPALLAMALRATETGSLRLLDLVHVQGVGLADWALLESPWSLLLGLGFLGSLVPVFGRRAALGVARGRSAPVGRIESGLAWFGLVVLSTLWVVMFLGGTGGAPQGSVLGALLLGIKTAVVLAAVLGLRRALGHLRSGESLGFFGPGVFVCAGLGATLFAASLWSSAFQAHLGLIRQGVTALFVLSTALLALSASRALRHTGRGADPWI